MVFGLIVNYGVVAFLVTVSYAPGPGCSFGFFPKRRRSDPNELEVFRKGASLWS